MARQTQTKVKTQLSPKDLKTLLIGSMISELLDQFRTWDGYIPYNKWTATELQGLTKKEFDFAVKEAYNLYTRELSRTFNKQTPNKNVKIVSNK